MELTTDPRAFALSRDKSKATPGRRTPKESKVRRAGKSQSRIGFQVLSVTTFDIHLGLFFLGIEE